MPFCGCTTAKAKRPFCGCATLHQEKLSVGTPFLTEKVRVSKLDKFNFQNISFIKIDSEGYEYEVLKGAVQTIIAWRPVV